MLLDFIRIFDNKKEHAIWIGFGYMIIDKYIIIDIDK